MSFSSPLSFNHVTAFGTLLGQASTAPTPSTEMLNGWIPWIVSSVLIILGLVVYGWSDLVRTSVRRIWAISSVCVTESLRRRVLWVTVGAIIATMVVSAFVKGHDEQDTIRQITKYCLFSSAMMITIIAVILAATNLPREIESRVIFTIVTKPTTRLEIVLGKVLGFARISAMILIIMGIFTIVYLHIRARPLLADLRTRLDRPNGNLALAADSPERSTDEYYLHSGLLGTRSLDWPEDPVQVFARPPVGNEYWMMGAENNYVLLGFDLNPQQSADFLQAARSGANMGLEMNLNFSLDVDQNRPPSYRQYQMAQEMKLASQPPWPPQVQVRYLDAGYAPLVPFNRLDPGTLVRLHGTPGAPYTGSVPIPPEILDKAAARGRFVVQVTARTPATNFGINSHALWITFTRPTPSQLDASHPPAMIAVQIKGTYGLYVDDGPTPIASVHLVPGDTYGFQVRQRKEDKAPLALEGAYTVNGVPTAVPLNGIRAGSYVWKYMALDVPMALNPMEPAPGVFGAHPGSRGQSLSTFRSTIPRNLLWSTLPFPFQFLSKQELQTYGPIAVFRFRNIDVHPGSDGKVGIQINAYLERTAENAISDDAEATIEVVNQKTGESSGQLPPFRVETSRTSPVLVDAKYTQGGDFDVMLRNITVGQNLGIEGGENGAVAVVSADGIFEINLVKSLFILWLLSVLVVIIAVFCSTFVSWPIAIVLTLVILLAHWGVNQLGDALSPGNAGRQTLQVFKVNNPTESFLISSSVDKLSWVLRTVSTVLPDVEKFPVTEDIARGVSIPGKKIGGALGVIFCYGCPMLVFSYVILRRKEVAP